MMPVGRVDQRLIPQHWLPKDKADVLPLAARSPGSMTKQEYRSMSKYEMKGQFTPENAALVLIDYQVGVLQFVHNMSPDTCLNNALLLAKAAALYKMPIVLTTSEETHAQGPLSPELQQALPDDFAKRVKRTGIVNAWADPNFSAAVRGTGRKNIIMGGITTDICLVFPSISAVQEGLTVQAIIDASGSTNQLQDDMARNRMENNGVILTTTNTAVAELVQDWSSPEGTVLIKLLMATAFPKAAA
jgi:nicotinamidase-related amidase